MEDKNIKFKRIYQKFYYQFLKRNYSGITAKSRVLPNFLIIGGVRCGTTSLYYDICKHPSVEKAAYDEIGFFDDNYHLGEEWYRSLFPTKKKMKDIEKKTGYSITGEDTPFYIWNEEVIEKIAKMIPNVKLIAILRNPIDRAYSNYQLSIREGTENRSFEEAIMEDIKYVNSQLQENKKLKNDDYKKSYIAKGIYVHQIKYWFEKFNEKQICILTTEEFSENPDKILSKIFKFLEIPDFSIQNFEKQKMAKYPKMNQEIRGKMNDFFLKYNEELFDLLDKKLAWEN